MLSYRRHSTPSFVVCLMFSFNLIDANPVASLTYTDPQLQGISYTPGIYKGSSSSNCLIRCRNSFTGLNIVSISFLINILRMASDPLTYGRTALRLETSPHILLAMNVRIGRAADWLRCFISRLCFEGSIDLA